MSDFSFNDDLESIAFVLKDLSHNPNISQKERDLVLDFSEYFYERENLTDKQLAVLSNIWEKY